MKKAIVITAYNRNEALQYLLYSLSLLKVENTLDLIIGIDNLGTPEVNKLAEEYDWKFGEKKVVINKEKRGLVKQFIWTGDQTKDYDVVVFLEDDLFVSPVMMFFVDQLADFYGNDNTIGAASLYNPFVNESTGCRFYQYDDGYDNYFLQQPYWGHVWFKKPWERFSKYLESYKENREILPTGIADWKGSFKKIFIQFLIENNLYVVTPRTSLVTNNGIPGIHSGKREQFFQSTLTLEPRKYSFSRIEESLSIYDSSMEILPQILKKYNENLRNFNFEVDLYGNKTLCNVKEPYILTSRPVVNPIFTFSSMMKPTELSVIFDQKGNEEIALVKIEDVKDAKSFHRKRRYKDIQKNYPVGLFTSYYFISYFFVRLFQLIIGFLKK